MGRTPLPELPPTSTNHNSSPSYARQLPSPASSSRGPVTQPSPSYPSASFMPPPPATPMHPPLPLHSGKPMAGRAFTPVTLPPIQTGYTTDRGQSERPVRLPGFSELAGRQPRDSESSHNCSRQRERENEVCSAPFPSPHAYSFFSVMSKRQWNIYVRRASSPRFNNDMYNKSV